MRTTNKRNAKKQRQNLKTEEWISGKCLSRILKIEWKTIIAI